VQIEKKLDVAVLGSGSWGTALAKHLADMGHAVRLWSRRPEQAEAIQSTRENKQYLPGFALPASLSSTASFETALLGAELVLSVIPSQETRAVWSTAKRYLPAGTPVLCASKGIENQTLSLMSEVLSEVIPGHRLGFIAGPSFAKEVAKHLPTAIVIGSNDDEMARAAQQSMSSDWMRAYVSHDVCGVELGGALKNVIAIACGCADGLGLGHNTRAAIITRGLAEITRMAVKLGAEPMTLAGLAGMCDLVLTCTGDLSRNRRVGLGLGQGKKLADILREMGQVAEGVETARAARDLSEKTGVEMPIAREVYAMLYEGKPSKEVVLSLMRRDLKHEQS
jgi:glycerol-3-phosphate dehydrogenase (NAD(P)+)